ncbi:probable inactive ATP-dependent zinc metalloprotease FTSHI 3, chloroplastic [Rutidosis leptorrhynchoides]|uniref:probable inactive ATP-dependent zinc metalloprotease FTSHI 3, chloroplastic n=1 Tax=Rutidosis leptorrhynchoides TaxID=125765 RepID=UPI003A99C565
MAMANLLFQPLPLIPPQRFTKRSSSSRYKTPILSIASNATSVSLFSRSQLSMHAEQPVFALNKEQKGFGGNMKWTEFAGLNSLSSYWDGITNTDEKYVYTLLYMCNITDCFDAFGNVYRPTLKFQCQWAKDSNVAETDNGTQSAKTKSVKSKKRSTSYKLRTKIYTVIVGASLCIVVAICSFSIPKQVPYSDLVGGIRDGNVVQVQFVENSRVIYFNTKPAVDQDAETPQSKSGQIGLLSNAISSKWNYHTRNVIDDKHQLIKMLKDQGITYGSDPELLSDSAKNFFNLTLQQAPLWIMVLISCYQLSHQLSLGKMKKRDSSKQPAVTFDDVEGVDSAKSELLEIVSCINEDSKYMKLGAKLPKGVLLAGPPGTGKTLLARAVAGEAGVSFFSISGSELVEVFVGTGAARVRDIFRDARKNSPSIIFIDEIDAVGGQRGRTLNCERDQTLNQLLTEMDGFEKDANVVVIAATNRPESLDSALMRPGRFSRKVLVGEPDEEGRRKIFGLYMRDVPMQEDKEAVCDLVASLTSGLVGADLANIANESALLAGRRGGEFVTSDDVLQAVARATTKIYDEDNDTETEPPSAFGPIAVGDQRFWGGPSIGFGLQN